MLDDGPDKEERVKAYVEQLYKVYCGGKMEVGTRGFLIRSLLDGSYTLLQAEMAVMYSKEAKERQKQLEQQKEEERKRRGRLEEYVQELFRVYVPSRKPSAEEVESYVLSALSGRASLQQLEDSISALGVLSALPSVPATKKP